MHILGLPEPSPHLRKRRHPITKLLARRADRAKVNIYWASMRRSVGFMSAISEVVRSLSYDDITKSMSCLISCPALAEPASQGLSSEKAYPVVNTPAKISEAGP